MTKSLQEIIEQAWQQNNTSASPQTIYNNATYNAIIQVIDQLNTGSLRVAYQEGIGKWQVNQWIKKAILLYFKFEKNVLIATSHTNYLKFYDKIPTKFAHYTAEDFMKGEFRVVPPAVVRRGAFIGKKVVLMPSYVNIGAFIDDGAMIDTWSTIGSAAQIGKNVHISGGVGIGGVLEPIQAGPVVIENNCFIGARSEIVEGVIVEENSVLAMGTYIGQSTKIYDRNTSTIHYGRVPAGSVVVPGSLPSQDGKHNVYAVIIMKKVNAKTREKISINELLREN